MIESSYLGKLTDRMIDQIVLSSARIFLVACSAPYLGAISEWRGEN